jgi:ribonuclease HI
MTIKAYCTAVSRDIKKSEHVSVWALYDDDTPLQAGARAYKGTTHNRACAWSAFWAVDALSSVSMNNQNNVQLLTDSSYIGRYFTNWEQYQHWQLNGFRTKTGDIVKNLDLLFLYWLFEKRAQKRVNGKFVTSGFRDEEMLCFLEASKEILPRVSVFDYDPSGLSLFDWPDVISEGLIDFDTSVALHNAGGLYHA